MAKVKKPRYGVQVEFKNGTKTVMWFQSEAARDHKHAILNRDPKVKIAKRVSR